MSRWSWVEKPRPASRPAGAAQSLIPRYLVGAGGFEPPNGRSKVSWLTTCRRPNGARGANLRMGDPKSPGLPLADAPTEREERTSEWEIQSLLPYHRRYPN